MASTPVEEVVGVEIIRKGQKIKLQVETGELKEEAELIAPAESSSSMGMVLQQITPELVKKLDLAIQSGLLVIHVENSSAASEAGLLPGDIILEVDQTEVVDLAEFNRRLKELKDDDTVLFLVKRGGATIYVTHRLSR